MLEPETDKIQTGLQSRLLSRVHAIAATAAPPKWADPEIWSSPCND